MEDMHFFIFFSKMEAKYKAGRDRKEHRECAAINRSFKVEKIQSVIASLLLFSLS